MLSNVVTQSVNAAQVFFLIALICGAIATVFAIVVLIALGLIAIR